MRTIRDDEGLPQLPNDIAVKQSELSDPELAELESIVAMTSAFLEFLGSKERQQWPPVGCMPSDHASMNKEGWARNSFRH
jgi:hypothetical protein